MRWYKPYELRVITLEPCIAELSDCFAERSDSFGPLGPVLLHHDPGGSMLLHHAAASGDSGDCLRVIITIIL
jgi:hypothetical protein